MQDPPPLGLLGGPTSSPARFSKSPTLGLGPDAWPTPPATPLNPRWPGASSSSSSSLAASPGPAQSPWVSPLSASHSLLSPGLAPLELVDTVQQQEHMKLQAQEYLDEELEKKIRRVQALSLQDASPAVSPLRPCPALVPPVAVELSGRSSPASEVLPPVSVVQTPSVPLVSDHKPALILFLSGSSVPHPMPVFCGLYPGP